MSPTSKKSVDHASLLCCNDTHFSARLRLNAEGVEPAFGSLVRCGEPLCNRAMPVRWWITRLLMMNIVAMHMGNCQPTSLTTNYDAFLQAYNKWYLQELHEFLLAYDAWKRAESNQRDGSSGKVPPPELAAFYDKTRELATAAVQWCHQEPGLWRRIWSYYQFQTSKRSNELDFTFEGYVSWKPNYTSEQIRALCSHWFYPRVHYYNPTCHLVKSSRVCGYNPPTHTEVNHAGQNHRNLLHPRRLAPHTPPSQRPTSQNHRQ